MSKQKTLEELRAGVDDPARGDPRYRKLYAKRVAEGRCCYCGAVPPAEGKRACDPCAIKYGRHLATVGYYNEWKKRKIAEGLCSKCGVNPHAEKRKLCAECLRIGKEKALAYYRESPERCRRQKLVLKVECFNAYGGAKCSCCGFVGDLLFLTLGHGNNNGADHRRSIWGVAKGGGCGEHMYYWLKKRGYPQDLGFRVECWNCNCAAAKNKGVCPHKNPQPDATSGGESQGESGGASNILRMDGSGPVEHDGTN